MKVRLEQLEGQLQRGLAPIYLLSGDEPLQMMEASALIRQAARADGYSEREVIDVESGFDWASLAAVTDNLSLFAERRIVELRLNSPKPGDSGSKALVAYCGDLPPDTVLMITMGKLEAAQLRSKWVKTIESAGALLQIWPIDHTALPGWIMQRAKRHQLLLPHDVALYLATMVEGNLLAASQELEKLALLYHHPAAETPQATPLTIEQVEHAVGQASRYTIFTLVDCALAGDVARVVRVMQGLEEEGEDSVKLLWALDREIRTLVPMAEAVDQGRSVSQVIREYHVWAKRIPLVQAALQRHTLKRWHQLQLRAGRVDRIAKGVEPGIPWDELLQLALLIAGTRIV